MCQTIEKHPGKFEGKTCITKFAYYYVGSGDGLECKKKARCIILKSPFSHSDITEYQDATGDHICPDCWQEILNMGK